MLEYLKIAQDMEMYGVNVSIFNFLMYGKFLNVERDLQFPKAKWLFVLFINVFYF